MTRVVLAFLLAVVAPAGAFAGDVPYLTGRVVDNADILSPDARTRLTAVLKAHEDATSNQIAVLTVPSIQPQCIEEYAVDVFNTWKLGQKDRNNGVLVVVVPQERRMRIEVGYGLEPILTDAAAGAIVRAVMTPAFKRGDYDGGVENGVAAIIARLEGRTAAVAAPRVVRPPQRRSGFQRADIEWPMRILLCLFVFSIIGLFTFIGIVTPGTGWFLYVFLIPFWSMFPMVLIGPVPTLVLVAAYLIGYPLVKLRLAHTAGYQKAAVELTTKGRATVGGFAVVSAGGGGSFSSGGGFSGGGGSSGGGGASGSW